LVSLHLRFSNSLLLSEIFKRKCQEKITPQQILLILGEPQHPKHKLSLKLMEVMHGSVDLDNSLLHPTQIKPKSLKQIMEIAMHQQKVICLAFSQLHPHN
jgi:hypothetical protein